MRARWFSGQHGIGFNSDLGRIYILFQCALPGFPQPIISPG